MSSAIVLAVIAIATPGHLLPSGGHAHCTPQRPMTALMMLAVMGAAPTSADVDPAAVAALERMSAWVRGLTAFQVKAALETEELERGQKVTRHSTIELTLHRPNRLRADVRTDRTVRHLFYDGHSFTIWSPRAGYYASADAPGTLADLVTLAAEKYAIDLPFAEVFPWEHFEARALTAAVRVGLEWIEGVECEHFAFRQPGLDWELWLERGPDARPKKVQLTSTGENPQPDRRVTYGWARGAGEETQFTFTPSRDARKIELRERANLTAEAP